MYDMLTGAVSQQQLILFYSFFYITALQAPKGESKLEQFAGISNYCVCLTTYITASIHWWEPKEDHWQNPEMQTQPSTLPHTRSQGPPEKGERYEIFSSAPCVSSWHLNEKMLVHHNKAESENVVFQLLKRNASSRLGAGPGDAAEVQVNSSDGCI